MVTTLPKQRLPLRAATAGFRRFSVKEYHRLIEIGILTEDDNLELIEGYLIHKMSRNPPHDSTLNKALLRLLGVLVSGWTLRTQSAITLAESEPEPDFAIVLDRSDSYHTSHPSAAEVGLVVEVSDSTLESDRTDKGRIYAGASIPVYWIINIPDRWIEVYTQPSGPIEPLHYAQRTDYRPGDLVPFVLNGQMVASIPVVDLLPS